MKISICFFYLMIPYNLLACINFANPAIVRPIYYEDERIQLPGKLTLNYEKLYRYLDDLEFLIEDETDKSARAKLENDYAAVLIYLGRYAEAKMILEANLKQYPDSYTSNVNLGTLYELSGNAQKAYGFIQKALKIDSTSHANSEWIHLNILRIKKEVNSLKEYLEDNFIAFDENSHQKSKIELKRMAHQISYQLTERMTLVDRPDLIIGRLLYELGSICIQLGDNQEAVRIFAEAKKYGFQSDRLFEQKKMSETRLENKWKHYKHIFKRSEKLLIYLLLLVVFVSLLVYVGWKWRRNKTK